MFLWFDMGDLYPWPVKYLIFRPSLDGDVRCYKNNHFDFHIKLLNWNIERNIFFISIFIVI